MKILVLDEEFPYPLNTGKRIRSFHLIRRLAAVHEVHDLAYGRPGSAGFRALADAQMHPLAVSRKLPAKSGPFFYARLFANLFSRYPYIVTGHYSPAFQAAVDRALNTLQPNLVICEWTPYAVFVRDIHGVKTMIAAHNVEADIWRKYYAHETSPLKKWYIGRQLPKVERFERLVFRWVAGATAVSDADAQKITALAGDTAVGVVENGVDLDYFGREEDEGETAGLVFTGSMDWRPNQDAAIYFVRDIFPRLREEHPDIEVHIVGRNPPRHIVDLHNTPGVVVTGTVDDIRPYFRRAAVYIVPLRIGGGSRLKILEALAARKAVVSTTVGAEGLSVTDGREIKLADTPERFAKQIHMLLENPELRRRLGRAGRKLVEDRYGWDALAGKLQQFVADLT